MHSDKIPEQKSQSAARLFSQEDKGGEHMSTFVDNRPEAIAQRRLQAIVNKNLQVKQLKDFQNPANELKSQTSLQRKSTVEVVQRDLDAETMVKFMEWVRKQAEERNIHPHHMAALIKDAESLKEGFRTTLEQAMERMNSPAGFKKFEDLSDITRQAETAIRFGAATLEEVEAILIYLGKARIERFLSNGERVYTRSLPGADLMKNCHHYAFGGLKGDDKLFSYPALCNSLKIDKLPSGSLIDASQLEGVNNEMTITVRSYGVAHSSREEDGMVWHKFINVPCLFAIPTAPDLGSNVEKTFRVQTSAV